MRQRTETNGNDQKLGKKERQSNIITGRDILIGGEEDMQDIDPHWAGLTSNLFDILVMNTHGTLEDYVPEVLRVYVCVHF